MKRSTRLAPVLIRLLVIILVALPGGISVQAAGGDYSINFAAEDRAALI